MRQSELFTKTRKEAPKDEISKSAQLLIRGGFIHKEAAGVYTLLPLGLRVTRRIENIIREEMNIIGGVEMNLTALQDSKLWEKTGRWDDDVVDVWFKTKLKNDTEMGLGFTHEEPLTKMLTEHLNSYKDLPIYPYQFQTKFRNEVRAKSGIIRGREFVMKDLYSFSKDDSEHDAFYEKAKESYNKVFERVGIGNQTYVTFASGGVFSEFSHEFQTISDVGEDIIYLDREKKIAVNEEVYNDEVLNKLGLHKDSLEKVSAIEVGNIFPLGTKFSEPLGLVYDAEDGSRKPVVMGCYGIGIGRLMGTVAEVLSDNKGLIWPEQVSPFDIHLVNVSPDDEEVNKTAEEIYETLDHHNIEVLYDDRDLSAGEKLTDADLIGIPTQIILGKKSIESGEVEVKNRKSGEVEMYNEADIMNLEFKK